MEIPNDEIRMSKEWLMTNDEFGLISDWHEKHIWLRQRYGDQGLIELALAIASSRTFPVTKRVLGFAVSCSQVEVSV